MSSPDQIWFVENYKAEEHAYGFLNFHTRNLYRSGTRYARIPHNYDDKQEVQYKLLHQNWGINEPQLIISLHGSRIKDTLTSGHAVERKNGKKP